MRLTCIALCVAAAVAVAGAQTSSAKTAKVPVLGRNAPPPEVPGPQLRITDSLRIDGKKARFENAYDVTVGPNGRLLVYAGYSTISAFDSMGRRLWSKTPGRERDIADVTAVGWRGTEMWMSDARYAQIAITDSYGNVTRSIELPSWIRPTFSNRKSFPVFGAMRVYSVFPDGSMIVVPRRPHSLVGTTGYDERFSFILKVSEEGIIQRTIAKFQNTAVPAVTGGPQERNRMARAIPLNRSLFRVSPDGMRTVLVEVDTLAPNVDTITVRAFNDNGDTVYTRTLSYPASNFNEAQIDSVARQRVGGRAKALPRRSPAVVDLVMDYDKSVWITFRTTGSGRTVVGIDPSGNIIGALTVAPTVSVKAADRGRLWTQNSGNTSRDLVRYSIGK